MTPTTIRPAFLRHPLTRRASYAGWCNRAEDVCAAFANERAKRKNHFTAPGLNESLKAARTDATNEARRIAADMLAAAEADDAAIAAELAKPLPVRPVEFQLERQYRATLAATEAAGMTVNQIAGKVDAAITAGDAVGAEVWFDHLTIAARPGPNMTPNNALANATVVEALREPVQHLIAPADRRAALDQRELIVLAAGKANLIRSTIAARLRAIELYTDDWFAGIYALDAITYTLNREGTTNPPPSTCDTPQALQSLLGSFVGVTVDFLPSLTEVREAERTGRPLRSVRTPIALPRTTGRPSSPGRFSPPA